MPTPSYAVLFKAFTYEAFERRRLRALARRCGGGDLYLALDATRERAEVTDHDRVIRYTESEMVAKGYAGYPHGRLFWYNADYPLYYALEAGLEYDYYVMLEYDVAVNCDLDALVARVAAEGVDFVGEPMAKSAAEWMWLPSCRDAFPEPEPVHPYTICACVFSRKAALHLRDRRLELSARYRDGDIRAWPISEGFMSTEMIKAGFAVRSLSSYGRVPRLGIWPPYTEGQLSRLNGDSFVHPVLSGKRYVGSLFRNGLGAGLRARWQIAFSDRPPSLADKSPETVHREIKRSWRGKPNLS